MSKPTQHWNPSPGVKPQAMPTVAIKHPGNRVDKILKPLEASSIPVDVEPQNPYQYDIVICDNADRDLGKEVLKNPLHDAQLVYRMRGDVFHELDLWPMHWSKKLAATKVVLPHVDAVLAVSNRLAYKFHAQTGIETYGSAGLVKEASEWPTINHTDSELRAVTLTNCNYKQKIKPIIEWAPAVNEVLDEIGGAWTICGEGSHEDHLAREVEGYEHITFAGYVDAKTQLAKSNLMLHPSYLDGQPNSVLEGMASKLPVITNDFAAFEQYAGPLVVVHDTATLQERLRSFANSSLRNEWGYRGLSHIKSHHTTDAIAAQYERFCLEVMNDAD